MPQKKTVKKVAKETEPRGITVQKLFPYLLIVLAGIGLIASFILTIDKFKVLKDPNYVPSCNINPILSCGSVMKSAAAETFGFTNTILGLIAFAVIITIGVGMLAGATYKRWFWVGLQLGTIAGIGFIAWLFYNSFYVINSLCPFCMVVWAVTIPLFWYTLIYNLREGHIPTPEKLREIVAFIQRHHLDILIVIYLAIIIAILNRFWYYWSTLL